MTEAKASTPDATALEPVSQRDANGLFVKGNTIGKGHGPRGPHWTTWLRKAATEDRVKAIIERALTTAQSHPDWRAAAEARLWIFKHLSPTITAMAEENARAGDQSLQGRILALLEAAVAHAEETGTPGAAMAAMRALETAVNAVKAARSGELAREVAGELDLSKLAPEKLAQLKALLDEATVGKPVTAEKDGG